MLPPGHIAAGYLTTRIAIAELLTFYPQAAASRFWAVGILASVVIDLDDLYAFIRIGRPIAATVEVDHRKFISHAPFLHLFIAACGFGLASVFKSGDWQLYSLLYLVGTWTHFFFDSFGYGIMWLWPFDRKLYSFFNVNKRLAVSEKLPVVSYWLRFFREYLRYPPVLIEISLLIIALMALGFR
ncbi:MAG: metal-dependent hydrolase [Patescibacteria group bacterium]|nr:metal-dependent hydrolase [Patescibacteria group bacterium]